MKVFSKEKFILSEGYEVYLQCKDWVDECDGKMIIGKEIDTTGYLSDPDWEEEKIFDYDVS